MGSLDARGIIAVVEIVVYVPLLVISILLTLRHGFRRRAGWVFLLIFFLMRIIGSAIHIASEKENSNSLSLHITYSILEGAGVSPLLLATLGFLATTAQLGLDDRAVVTRGSHLMGLIALVAFAITIAGGVLAGSSSEPSQINQGITLRHAGVILFVVLVFLMVVMVSFFWRNKDDIMRHRQKLLLCISASLPFLAVRVLYSVLSAWAPIYVPGSPPPSDSGMGKFNSTTGKWGIYLVMSVIMEFIVVLIYTYGGITIPLKDDFANANTQVGSKDDMEFRDR